MQVLENLTITIKGENLPVVFLGRGAFSRAFLHRATNLVYLFTCNDPTKELMWQVGASVHIPVVEYVETKRNTGMVDTEVYTMPYLQTIQPQNKVAWRIMTELQRCREDAKFDLMDRYGSHRFFEKYGADVNQYICDYAQVPTTVSEDLRRLATAMLDYGNSYVFEFPQGNIGVNEGGRIMFRDVCFDTSRVKLIDGS
jgi:hypothetical protein